MLNKVLKLLSTFFRRTFCCFSLIALILSITGRIVNQDELSNYISVDLLISLFLFSLTFALAFAIADFVKENGIIRRALQFVLTYAGLVLVFFMGGTFENYVSVNAVQNKGFSILAISFSFVLIYVVCGVISLLLGYIKKKAENGEKSYDSMFENK